MINNGRLGRALRMPRQDGMPKCAFTIPSYRTLPRQLMPSKDQSRDARESQLRVSGALANCYAAAFPS